MSLILSSSALAAMLLNWGMLHLGVTAMWIRHPLAVVCAYATFLGGIGLWLRYVGLTRKPEEPSSSIADFIDNADTGDISIGDFAGSRTPAIETGGGESGGGGASAFWDGGKPLDPPVVNGKSSGIVDGIGGFGDLDGDAIVLLLLALLLLAAIFLLSGYIIWFAPDILSEAAFGAMLSSSLIRSAKRNDADGWVGGVVKKTWWPFAVVFVVATALAIYATAHYPAAHTLGEAIRLAVGR